MIKKEALIEKDKTYAITHSTRKILEKFKIWDKLKPHLFGFDTLSISDSVFSSSAILTTSDLDKDINFENNIGWVVKHSDLMKVFFQEVDKKENIFFKTSQKLSKEDTFFDFQFISTGANSFDKKILKFPYIQKSYNQSCLTFKVLIRGNFARRAYEIFRKEGPLALLPLSENVYQIIWTSTTSKTLDRLNSDKNFLLDNLSSILPDHFKLDQMIGEVNAFPVSLSLNLPIFNFKKLVLVGDSFHTFHPVGGQGLNTCWRDVNSIFDIFNSENFIRKKSLKLFKFKYYLNRFIDIFSIIIITDMLITIFANNNLILFPIRKISFFFLNNFISIRKLVLNQMTKSLIFSSIR